MVFTTTRWKLRAANRCEARKHSRPLAARRRYAQAIGEALGIGVQRGGGLRSAGYLHEYRESGCRQALFSKPSSLNPEEFREWPITP